MSKVAKFNIIFVIIVGVLLFLVLKGLPVETQDVSIIKNEINANPKFDRSLKEALVEDVNSLNEFQTMSFQKLSSPITCPFKSNRASRSPYNKDTWVAVDCTNDGSYEAYGYSSNSEKATTAFSITGMTPDGTYYCDVVNSRLLIFDSSYSTLYYMVYKLNYGSASSADLTCAGKEWTSYVQSNLKEVRGTVSYSTSSWIRYPFFSEEPVKEQLADTLCPSLNQKDCKDTRQCSWSRTACSVRSTFKNKFVAVFSLNPQNYYVYSTKIKKQATDWSVYEIGKIGKSPAYLVDNSVYVLSGSYYLVFERLDTSRKKETLTKQIKTDIIALKYNVIGELIRKNVLIEATNIQKLVQEENLKPSNTIDRMNLIAGTFTISELIEISKNSGVVTVFENKPVSGGLDTAELMDVIKAEPIDYYTMDEFGKGVKVCVLDSGIDDSHPFIGKLPDDHKKSFIEDSSISDNIGHGTHVAGIIMADFRRAGPASSGIHGVAPAVDLYVGKVWEEGEYSTDIMLEGMDWCVNDVKADIVSISIKTDELFGKGTCEHETLCSKSKSLLDSKTLFVVLAGNNGTIGCSFPGCCPGFITVASTNSKGVTSSFSSQCDAVDLAAVGENVLSTLPGNTEGSWSGTSMATPQVSGALAILKSLHPDATKQELLDAIISSATNTGAPRKEQGAGLLNVYAACNKIMEK